MEYSTIVNFDNRRNGEWHSGSSDTFSVDTPNLRALQPEGPDNAQLRTWVRVDPSSAANIQAVRLRLVDIEVDSPNAEHLAYQVHHAQTAFDATQWSGCNGDRGTVNANTGTLITEGESLHDVSDEEGMIIPRGSNVHRICVTLMPGPGLLPNDELDLTLTFAVGPE
ncbi:hypothetical protein [Nesterenkonia alba]|uniref:hypothetical protein n=1 Tax=Nesterenkonia alba TaxID=515814 RepID=UPI0012EBBA95|nr:hypothetical protein [Nesterenkonia alba]